MVLRDLQHAKELFYPYRGRLVGVGMTAFSRIAAAGFLDAYHVVALSRTADIPHLRKKAHIFCLEEAGGSLPEDRRHSAALLAHDLTRKYLGPLPKPVCLLLYQSYPELEDLAEKEGWVSLGNPGVLRLRLRGRHFFQQMANDLGLSQIPGAIYPIASFLKKGYKAWADELGPEWVVQLADIAQGGGRGTFFIRSSEAYDRLRERLGGGAWRDTPLRSVLIRKWIKGTPASVAVCVTRHGILISGLQRQLIDLPYCPDCSEDGVFCGHVWDPDLWAAGVRASAIGQARQIGDYVASLGYRGILGIDFIVVPEANTAYPLEINPRFTGAFPMLSFLHMEQGIIPLDVFHLIEFLNIPYELDVDGLNEGYQQPLRGSHLLLFLPPKGRMARGLGVRAGVYETGVEGDTIRFVCDGMEYADIRRPNQFIVVDGPPLTETMGEASKDPFSRLCHILFPSSATDIQGGLTPHARRVLDWIYGVEGHELNKPV